MLEVKADLRLSPKLRFLSVWVKSIVLPRSFLSLVFSWFNSVVLIVLLAHSLLRTCQKCVVACLALSCNGMCRAKAHKVRYPKQSEQLSIKLFRSPKVGLLNLDEVEVEVKVEL